MNKFNSVLLSCALASSITACASSTNTAPSVQLNNRFQSIPAWVINPSIEQGIGAASCVAYSGNLSVDQKLAVSNARVALAQQISSKIESLEKSYSQRQDANNQSDTSISFEAISKTVTSESLRGSRADQFGIATINEVDHYCAHVVIDEEDSHSLFISTLNSHSKLNETEQDFLYQEFKAHKAEQSLEKALAEHHKN